MFISKVIQELASISVYCELTLMELLYYQAFSEAQIGMHRLVI